MFDQHTKLFFSISAKPGILGSLLYNTAFQKLGINAIYKPVRCDSLAIFVELIESLKSCVSGASISMPYKKKAAELCNVLTFPWAETTRNVNTIKFEYEQVIGYNTDAIGFMRSCKPLLEKSKSAVIYGTGAVSDSIYKGIVQEFVLHGTQDNITRFERFSKNSLSKVTADLFINATPVGMDGVDGDVFNKKIVERYKYVFDVVIKKGDTKLIKTAKKLGKDCVSGVRMHLEQLCKQFKIYTGIVAPRDLFEKLLEENGY